MQVPAAGGLEPSPPLPSQESRPGPAFPPDSGRGRLACRVPEAQMSAVSGGQGGALPVAILGVGEIQRAVYIERHFSGFNTKSSIANDSRGGFCLILCFNATPSLGFFKVSSSGGATLGCK